MASAAGPSTSSFSVPHPQPSSGRRVLVGVGGGIAAYKVCAAVSKLVQAGHQVRVAMTPAAARFVGELTFQALSGQSVLTSPWQHDDRPDSQHVGLARWAEAVLVAPATADLIARLAAGLCDDVVGLTVAAKPAATPLVLAPAMNADMWDQPILQRNLKTLAELLPGLSTVGPAEGWQACRTRGAGRMAEADELVAAVQRVLG